MKILKDFWLLFLFLFIILALWFANLFIPPFLMKWLDIQKDDYATRGQFGDMFGTVNSLFAGLAFAFLAYTVWQQHKEFQLQREVLQAQQKELKAQAKHLETQANHFAEQIKLFREQLKLAKGEKELREKELAFQKSKLLPKFVIDADDSRYIVESTYLKYCLVITNVGVHAHDVSVNIEPSPLPDSSPSKIANWDYRKKVSFDIRFPTNADLELVIFKLIYKDSESHDIEEKWKLTKTKQTDKIFAEKLK